jgi:hypothetical protein
LAGDADANTTQKFAFRVGKKTFRVRAFSSPNTTKRLGDRMVSGKGEVLATRHHHVNVTFAFICFYFELWRQMNSSGFNTTIERVGLYA